MKHTIVYTSDVHGNEVQYQLLFEYATQVKADSIIDDAAINMKVLEEGNGKLYQVIHGKRLKLTEKFEIVGYSYVPITPFGIKDWEKFDFSEVPSELAAKYAQRKDTNYCFNGYKSTSQGWVPFTFTAAEEQANSIQRDLNQEIYTKNPSNTLYIIHTLPNNTHLDQTYNEHVGSLALRQFIEKHQPYVTLHGHIHETVAVSEEFQDHIGKTLCMSSGNHNVGKQLAVIVFDLYRPQEAERKILSAPSIFSKFLTRKKK